MALTKVTSGVRTIASGEVVTASIADDAVTLAKMAGGTDGNLITYDASGDPAYVATGTTSQVLTSNGAGAAPTFQTPATPATPSPYGTLISTQEASASTSIDFTSVSGYDLYTLVIDKMIPSTDLTYLRARISTGGTFNSGASDYGYDTSAWNGGAAATNNNDGANDYINLSPTTELVGSASGESFSGEFVIVNLDSASLFTGIVGRSKHVSARTVHGIMGGDYLGAAETNDGIRLVMNTGNIASGTFALYGSNV